jgi:cytochrome P450
MGGLFNAYSYEAVHEVLKDGTGFSSQGYAEVMGQVMGHSILEMDEPEHHTYRALVQQSFTRKAMDRWEVDVVAPTVNGLIDQFVDDGRADLVRQLLWPFPVDVIAAMLGLPLEDRPMFHKLAVELIAVSVDMDLAIRASGELREYFAAQLDQRRAAEDPEAKDVISVLARAELDGVRLTDEEIFAFLRLLLPAGAETTYRSSSNLLCGLLTHPDQLEAVRSHRDLVPTAIEEGLRWEPPLLTIVRTATADTTIAGLPVPAGSTVITNLGAANHDAERWDDPERFDIHREPQPHISFAHGPHSCLGMHLARMESQVVLEAVLDRLPGLRLDSDAPPPEITGLTFRAPASLDVVWDV